MRTLFLPLLVLLTSCSTIQKMALKSSSPILVQGINEMMSERNWDFYRDSAPGNLKLLESLYFQDRNNMLLLGTLVKGYATYSFAVPETLFFEDEIAGIQNSSHKKMAIELYTRALDYGLDYFKNKGITRKALLDTDETELKGLLNEKMNVKDYSVILYTAQVWGSLINLQKDNTTLSAHAPKVRALQDWVCHKRPEIENGLCSLLLPRVASEYQDAIKKHPKHLLIRVGYIQNSLIPAMDRASFEEQDKILLGEFIKWDDLNRDDLVDSSEYKSQEQLNLMNAIAKKRFEIIKKHQW